MFLVCLGNPLSNQPSGHQSVQTSMKTTEGKPSSAIGQNQLMKSTIPQPGILNNAKTAPVLMCMIFTTPAQWEIKGLAVKLTWAKRCDYYSFFYSKSENVTLQGAHGLDVPEGREHLTAKSMKAFQLSYAKFGSSVDWYLKADDDTYVIVENLRAFVSLYDPGKPVYLGHTSQDLLPRGYNSGGAGYVLSSEAVRLMVEQGDKFPSYCSVDGAIEDLDIGRCLQAFRSLWVKSLGQYNLLDGVFKVTVLEGKLKSSRKSSFI